MIIKNVSLINFRSHEEYVLKCRKNTSLILGENGSGKTSVLEAIYICMRGKSFRAVDADIMKRGKDFYRAELEYESGEKIIATFDGDKKSFLVQDKKTVRLPKKNRYPVVLFLPDDLHLISSSPTRKREYFDRILAVIDDGYGSILSRYEKTLRQRNDLLKKMAERGVEDADMIFSWNVLLAKYGTEIKQKRRDFIEKMNERLTEVYRSIAENEDEVKIFYDTKEGDYLGTLMRDLKKDLILGHTSFGVHRDNYEFIFNGKDADGSASRGEVRSVVLAMKFIEAELIYKETGRKPIVLLDDVFSELDEKRQASLVKNFKENQVIITSVDGVEL